MPSQIKVDEIKNVAGQYKIKTNVFEGQTTAGSIAVRGEGTNTTNLQQGLAKVWANLNGTGTIALRDSYNISSVTDNGTGNYTYAISSNMGNANYANTSMGNEGNAGDVMIDDNNAEPTTSAIRVQARQYTGGATADPDFTFHTAHGDLA